MKRLLAIAALTAITSMPALADYKISQKIIMEGMAQESTVYAKGVRERREQKMSMEGVSPEEAAMMASYMPPSLTTISQCDLKQDVSLNDKKRLFYIDYYDWSAVPAEKQQRRPARKMIVKGTMTMSSTVTDSGRRQQMFGLTARWVKAVQTMEASADSCDGASNSRIEREGWFVDLSLNRQSCPTPAPQGGQADGGCRPKVVIKSMQDPGFFLEGTTTMYENGKKSLTTRIETTALSRAILDQALFEVPKDYSEVDSLSELMQGSRGPADTTAVTTVQNTSGRDRPSKPMKTVAIDFFAGSSSKLDQNQLRSYISEKLSEAGISGYLITSQAELQSGNFANVIAVEISKAKESGAAKIGGLFGKVTGTADASKVGDSEAAITMTLLGQDRKTIVVAANAGEKVKGSLNDAVKAAIDRAMPEIISKLK